MVPRVNLDGCGKFCSFWHSVLEFSNPQPIAVPATLSWLMHTGHNFTKSFFFFCIGVCTCHVFILCHHRAGCYSLMYRISLVMMPVNFVARNSQLFLYA